MNEAHSILGSMPVWTIILAIIGMLMNLVIGLIAWSISGKLGDLKASITTLTSADHELAAEMRAQERASNERISAMERANNERINAVERDLDRHKLDAARTYTTIDNYNRTTATLFAKLDDMKGEIVDNVHELCRSVNARIDSLEGCRAPSCAAKD